MPSEPAASFRLDPDVARWLVSGDGLARLDAVVAALDAGDDELTVGTRLRRDGLAGGHARAVVDAATARRRARARLDDADALVLTTTALEQSSHPAVSALRAARYAGAAEVTDLCSGVGLDALALAGTAGAVTAVDLDAARLTLLAHNAAVRGVPVTTVVADVLTYAVPPGGLVHADPGRRAAGRRLRRLDELLPPVPSLLRHVAAAAGVGVALSPAVDLADPGLPEHAELEFVQVGSQLVEASCWLGGLRDADATASATLLPAGEHRRRAGAVLDLPVGPVGRFLLEPQPAAVRARLHDELGREIGAWRLARRRALLTTDTLPSSPWFTAWEVVAELPLRPRTVASWLREHAPGPIEIATHGVDADPGAWWRQLGKPPRGPGGTRVHLVRLDTGATCLIGQPVG